MRDRLKPDSVSMKSAHSRPSEQKDAASRLVLGKAAPPLLQVLSHALLAVQMVMQPWPTVNAAKVCEQALTLTTSFASAERLRPRNFANGKPIDFDQSISSQALQIIKAAHTAAASSTGMLHFNLCCAAPPTSVLEFDMTAGQTLAKFPNASSGKTAVRTSQAMIAGSTSRLSQLQDSRTLRNNRSQIRQHIERVWEGKTLNSKCELQGPSGCRLACVSTQGQSASIT